MTDLKFDSEPALAASFPPAAREDWLKLVEGVLKGRPFERLISRSYDGLPVGPLYGRAAEGRPVTGRAPAPWQMMARIDHPDPAAANAQALADLEGGATGLTLVFPGSAGAYGFGAAWADDALARVLEGVHLDAGIALELDLSPATKDAASVLAALVRTRGAARAATTIRFGFDPLGAIAMAGAAMAWRDIAPIFTKLFTDLAREGFSGPFATADARPIHAAGGSEAQELAFALAAAVAYLRALEAGGVDLDAARRMIFFRLAADADQFLTLAKLRALRKLWARVEDACDLVPQPIFVSAETAWRMMTRRDPHVNLLRTTLAAFSAAAGGADAIAVLPFTAAVGLPDPFARRLARNIQLLLAEESSLAKVSDPGAGSGAVEALTAQLCATAWALFQEIERAGGAAAALDTGLLQEKIAAVRIARQRAVAKRADVLTGTTEFPNLREAAADVLLPMPAIAASHAGSDDGGQAVRKALPRVRFAEPFETLRDASDRVLAETGARPRIFLATLGTAADFSARAAFARSLFETGGIEAVLDEDANAVSALATAFRQSGAKLACLCSSDDIYAAEAEAAARALTEAGAAHIYLAGRSGEREAAFRATGIGDFVYAGCDALSTLRAAHDRMSAR